MEENPIYIEDNEDNMKKNPIKYTEDIYYFSSVNDCGLICKYPSPEKFGKLLADFMKLKQVYREISSITPFTSQGDTVGYWVILKNKNK